MIFLIVDKFEVSFNFFFELKSLEGLVLEIVLLRNKKKCTWSVGRRKAGVKNNLSWLKVGIILFAIPCALCF